MKKILFFISIVAVVTMFSLPARAGIHLGIKGGYNASTLSTNFDSIKSSMSSGGHFGLWARLGGRFHVQPELLYTFSGMTIENIWEQKIKVQTLDIPIILGFNIVQSKVLKLRLNAGPKLALKINSSVKNLSTLSGPITQDDLNTSNWSIQAGAGVDVLFLILDIRYQIGLSDVLNKAKSAGSSSDINGKTSMFVISAGIKIF